MVVHRTDPEPWWPAMPRLRLCALLLAALSLPCACTKPADPAVAAKSAAGDVAALAAPADPRRATACTLVSASEMSAIVGSAVAATPDETHGGKTLCTYAPAVPVEHSAPYVELSVEWGSGEALAMGAGFANAQEPGLVDAYEGLGDGAMRAGPAIMIRSGEDLVTIVISGVDEEPAAIRTIFDTAKARL